jgi:hypothetical protein
MAEMLHPPVAPTLGERWRQTLFGDIPSAIVSGVLLLAIAWAAWHALRWGVFNAEIRPDASACRVAEGACWGVLVEKARLVLLGRFPRASSGVRSWAASRCSDASGRRRIHAASAALDSRCSRQASRCSAC